MTLAQIFLDRDLQQKQGQGSVPKSQKSSREESGSACCWLKGFVSTQNRSLEVPANCLWKEVETLTRMKEVLEVLQFGKQGSEIWFSDSDLLLA